MRRKNPFHTIKKIALQWETCHLSITSRKRLKVANFLGLPLIVVCIWAVFTQSKVLEDRQKMLLYKNSTQVRGKIFKNIFIFFIFTATNTPMSVHGSYQSWVDLHGSRAPPTCPQCLLPRLHLLCSRHETSINRTTRSIRSPELESSQGFIGHHSLARNHLPHHYCWSVRH